jgi:hypothetical protein
MSAHRRAGPLGGFSMAERENKNRRPAASQSRNTDRSRMVAITSRPEQSCGRSSKKSAGDEGCTRLAKILVPMLREAMDYEASQADSQTKGVSNDPET